MTLVFLYFFREEDNIHFSIGYAILKNEQKVTSYISIADVFSLQYTEECVFTSQELG